MTTTVLPARSIAIRSAVLMCVLGLTACTSLRVHDRNVVRGLPPDQAVADPQRTAALAVANDRALEYYQRVEWPLQLDPDHPPGIAVALSGGGMRSAVFSLGVLSGLHELGVFPQRTDLLSAVSGGGYIASWFYAQQILYPQYTAHDLLDPAGVPHQYLQRNADFVQLIEHPGGIVAGVTTIVPMAAVNVLANGVFGWHANTPVTSRYYKYRFQKTFFSSCDTRQGTQTVSWQQVHGLVSAGNASGDPERRLPNLILNTTVALGYKPTDKGQRGYNAIYEFTPQRFGSDGMGYRCYANAADADCKLGSELGPLERIAVTSGAAYDTSQLGSVAPGRVERLVASGFNFDLGHFFANPGAEPWPRWHLAIPLLYGFTKSYRLDSGGRRMLLTDGGHTDNLGIYSLVRRVPAVIVVVDADLDPNYLFETYRRLRRMLLDDMGVVLSVPAIDDGHLDFGPVFYGTVGSIPHSNGPQPRQTRIIYIKLPRRPANRADCRQVLPDNVCTYVGKNKDFPFDHTFGDQAFDSEQFAAYRDLGLAIVRHASDRLKWELDVTGR